MLDKLTGSFKMVPHRMILNGLEFRVQGKPVQKFWMKIQPYSTHRIHVWYIYISKSILMVDIGNISVPWIL